MKDFKSIENDIVIERNKKHFAMHHEVRTTPYPFNWIIFVYKYSPLKADREMYEKLNKHFSNCDYEKLIIGFDKILEFIKCGDKRWENTDRNIDMFQKVFKSKMTYTNVYKQYGLTNHHIINITHHVSHVLKLPKYQYMMLGICNPTEIRKSIDEEYNIFGLIMSDLSTRTKNCIMRAGINTIEDFNKHTVGDLMWIRCLGSRSMDELLTVLNEYGVELRKQKPGDRHYIGERGSASLINQYEDVIIKHFGSIDNI